MLELPEAITLAKQLNENITGKRVTKVYPPTKPHKFCWFNGEPDTYDKAVSGCKIIKADGFGIFAELFFDNGMKLCINDGVNLRLMSNDNIPKDYQLLIKLDDGQTLAFTVAMYGGICLHDGSYDNKYYLSSQNAVTPFSADFSDYYYRLFSESKPILSVKAFLATEQRFPGIGNGILQDILFNAKINPKRKLSTLSENEKDTLLNSIITVLKKMTELGGRDTEKDLFGAVGGYRTVMSKNGVGAGCPDCGGAITKESYMGGSVYYCPKCQPDMKK